VARSYHAAAASLALGCDPKWLDNLLSRYAVEGVTRERQGVARRVSSDALVRLAIVRALVEDLSLGTPTAIMLAQTLCDEQTGICILPSGLSIQIDLTRVRRDIERRLLAAPELTAPPPRGRPPSRAAP
jgi:hypothetical protein